MSELYTTLLETSHEFINSTAQITSPEFEASKMDEDRLRAIRSTTYHHSFGPAYMVSKRSNLHDMDIDGFINHVNRMLPSLRSWQASICQVWVDEAKKQTVLRVMHRMLPKGVDEKDAIGHEIMWTLSMDATGKQVVNAVEYLDALAVKDLGELLWTAK